MNGSVKKETKDWAKEYGEARLAQAGVPLEHQNNFGEWFNVIDLKFNDGSFVTILTDITSFKESEKKGEEFRDAINEIPYNIDMWHKDDKLIYEKRNSLTGVIKSKENNLIAGVIPSV